jgi:CRISPR/Cas system-associated exonuclease Cas4 (RecB family)
MPRKRNLYIPGSEKPFKMSRSKVDLYIECPRCFYLDRRLGVGRPPGFPFNLNSAVDTLLKSEFDSYRVLGEPHPIMTENGLSAVPMRHLSLNEWRENFKGIRYLDKQKNIEFFGAIDDLWLDTRSEQAIVVDYKATSKAGEVSLDAKWQNGYKRQMEFYQWLLRKNGLDVSDTGYFVYTNGLRDLPAFENRLEFKTKLIPYTGSDNWIDSVITEIHHLLELDEIPTPTQECNYCKYVEDLRLVAG